MDSVQDSHRSPPTVKHELSHRSMLITCGTTEPIIAGDRYEGVTSAYAVLFFGANEQVLNSAVIPVINDPNESQETRDAAAKYLVDDQGKAIARQIHDERKCR